MFFAMQLAKAGYFSGDPQSVLNAPVTVVQAAIHYESFVSEYETAYHDLNKGDEA